MPNMIKAIRHQLTDYPLRCTLYPCVIGMVSFVLTPFSLIVYINNIVVLTDRFHPSITGNKKLSYLVTICFSTI